jgi:hypothetical protein
MFKSLKCYLKGHLYIDSRSQPGSQVCVRCRHRLPFEGLTAPTGAKPQPARTKPDQPPSS